MGRNPCPKEGLNRGTWTAHEDELLREYVRNHGEGKWGKVFKETDLKRCGKSCRLRWLNYLRPNIKRGNITQDEEDLIIRLHKLLGNRWSLIAGRLPGRTDNEIKNYWNSTLRKKLVQDTHNSKRQNIKETKPINTSPTMVKAQLEDSNITTTHVQASMIQGTLPAAKHVTEQTYSDDKLNFLSNCDNTNDASWDFMVELNGEQFRLSDFLHADFSNLSPSSSSSERAALFSEAMLKNLSTEDTIQTEYDFDP